MKDTNPIDRFSRHATLAAIAGEILVFLLVAACLALSGCGHHEHEHEDHLEHHTPEHKPADLAAAAVSLSERCQALTESPSDARSDQVEQQLNELADIIRWLPELAGDSDLPEPQWNEVQALSRQFGEQLQVQRSKWRPGSPAPRPSAEDRERFLAQLKSLAAWTEPPHAQTKEASNGP